MKKSPDKRIFTAMMLAVASAPIAVICVCMIMMSASMYVRAFSATLMVLYTVAAFVHLDRTVYNVDRETAIAIVRNEERKMTYDDQE